MRWINIIKDDGGIAQLLCSVPLSYVVANVAQKAIYNKTDVRV